jgi:RHS repeat-associated protein
MISVDSGTTASYVYNALGERVEKDVGGTYTEYVFDKNGDPLGEDNRTTWTDTWIDFQGKHVAHYENGEAYFMHDNNVGTTAFVTDYSGAVVQDELHYPWGQEWAVQGTLTEERYAGLHHRDSETGLDPTHYRMYSSGTYRWFTPDPAESGIFAPQSMSRYAYAGGDPVNFTDPAGLIPYALPPGFNGDLFEYAFPTSVGSEGELVTGISPGGVYLGSGAGAATGGGGGATRTLVHVYNLHKTGADVNTVKARFQQIEQCLDPRCRSFLQSGGANVNSFISQLLGNNLLAVGNTESSIAAFTGITGTDVPPGYAAMVVNGVGAFFSSEYAVDAGKLTGGTPRAQAFILLHELGHALGAKGFQADFGNAAAGQANDKLIDSNCQATLNNFSSH